MPSETRTSGFQGFTNGIDAQYLSIEFVPDFVGTTVPWRLTFAAIGWPQTDLPPTCSPTSILKEVDLYSDLLALAERIAPNVVGEH